MLPVAAYALLQSIELLGTSCTNFARQCVKGLVATSKGPDMVNKGLMTCTNLVPYIGYDASAKIAKKASATGRTIAEARRRVHALTRRADALGHAGRAGGNEAQRCGARQDPRPGDHGRAKAALQAVRRQTHTRACTLPLLEPWPPARVSQPSFVLEGARPARTAHTHALHAHCGALACRAALQRRTSASTRSGRPAARAAPPCEQLSLLSLHARARTCTGCGDGGAGARCWFSTGARASMLRGGHGAGSQAGAGGDGSEAASFGRALCRRHPRQRPHGGLRPAREDCAGARLPPRLLQCRKV